jgi:hypothetical protein
MEPRNRFQGINSASLCSLAGRYDNPIPTRFLAPIDCLKIPAQYMYVCTTSLYSIKEGRAASKSPHKKFGYFLSISKHAVTANITKNSAVAIFES